VHAPWAQQLFHLGVREGGHGMNPLRGEVFDLLALAHAPVAHKRDRGDATSGLALLKLRSQGVRSRGMPRKHFA